MYIIGNIFHVIAMEIILKTNACQALVILINFMQIYSAAKERNNKHILVYCITGCIIRNEEIISTSNATLGFGYRMQ